MKTMRQDGDDLLEKPSSAMRAFVTDGPVSYLWSPRLSDSIPLLRLADGVQITPVGSQVGDGETARTAMPKHAVSPVPYHPPIYQDVSDQVLDEERVRDSESYNFTNQYVYVGIKR